jgi:hypothetical protein
MTDFESGLLELLRRASLTQMRSKYVIALGAKEMEIINRRRNEVES